MTEINNLPAALRENALFCCWRYEERDGRRTKVPYNPRTGGRAQSTNPDTFAPLQVAAQVQGRYDGLGVGIFGRLGAIDIDHCVSEEGELSDLAASIMSAMDAYTEYSPSGKGFRILFTVPEGFRYDKARYYINNQKAGLEVYIAGSTNKFVTVTGNTITPGKDLEERGEALGRVLERYMVRPQAVGPTPPPAPSAAGRPAPVDALDDLALIERAKQSRKGADFARLWAGDVSGYQSHSEADIALCNALAWWTNGDAGRVDRLFRQSGLMRQKWDRPQSGSTYGAITVQNAVAGLRGGYDPQSRGQALDWMPEQQPAEGQPQGAAQATVKPPDYSDAGNATVFTGLYQNDLIFVDALGWLWWNGSKWERDDHKAMTWALDLSARMLKEARDAHRVALQQQAESQARYMEDGDEEARAALDEAKEAAKRANAYLKHAQALRGAPRLKNMLELAKPALVLKAAKLDANPLELNTPAGIVNLTTGQLRPHDRFSYCSKITEASAGPAGAEMWDRFLEQTTCGDGSIRGFLQLVAGMALIGTVYQEGIVIAYGGGRNGKSTFFNALGRVLGDYTGHIDVKTLTTDRQNRGASLATLRGRRLVITGELEEHQRLSVATLKQVASTDTITIEEKYKQPEEVKPSHTLILFTNHLPRVGSTDTGTWRRLIAVPFKATIPEGQGVQNFGDVLAEQAGEAILSWAIEGAINFVRNGFRLDIPEAVQEATEAYREREDWLNNFINERCVREPNARVRASELYAAYREWAGATGDYVRRLNEFTSAMEDAGFRNVKPQNKSTWLGLRLDYSATFANHWGATV